MAQWCHGAMVQYYNGEIVVLFHGEMVQWRNINGKIIMWGHNKWWNKKWSEEVTCCYQIGHKCCNEEDIFFLNKKGGSGTLFFAQGVLYPFKSNTNRLITVASCWLSNYLLECLKPWSYA